MRKKVDSRVRTLIENGVRLQHRTFFVVVGDKARDQVMNLHYILSKSAVKARPSVLWCYKKELDLSSHRKKRMRQIKKMMQRGLLDPDKDDPFELFMSSTNIRWCYYADTHKVLGATYGMCVLQDFEALTPNLLARTIETVEGGGIVVLLLQKMDSLQQLYTMAMDAHARFRTESQHDVAGRFNERFLLSLGDNRSCLCVDDELNILPLSSHARSIVAVAAPGTGSDEGSSVALSPVERELLELKESLVDTQPLGSLVGVAKTLDQAKAILTFVEAISEKTLRSTVALTASRGRGKSAALGVSIAAAVSYGYSNIFVTSPSPENLGTLFEFIFKGFDALGYKEHADYDIVQSTNPEFNKAVVRVNIYRAHRQTIQYLAPSDHRHLGQAELLVVDEAAAIPLPIVKKLLGPYLVFLSSTVNGYEGTGRALSLKLFSELREQARGLQSSGRVHGAHGNGDSAVAAGASRIFRDIVLEEPIRYAAGDRVEEWMNALLCLNANQHVPRILGGSPHPDECSLYEVNRDTLLSYHKASEEFLQRMMALMVASHYKNSPDDLLLLADNPAHRIFVLLGPVAESGTSLPDLLCVVQLALEGAISKESVSAGLSRGQRASGDLIPWTIAQQFQEPAFGQLSGARVVRIATHPELQRMGYGRKAVDLLTSYYAGDIAVDLSEDGPSGAGASSSSGGQTAAEAGALLTETLAPRASLPPLLARLSETKPPVLDYFGVSFGLTLSLYTFWERGGFKPVYLRQTANDLTGEHTCIMLRNLGEEGKEWIGAFNTDFRKRATHLFGYAFRSWNTKLALRVLAPTLTFEEGAQGMTAEYMEKVWNSFDLRRLESYSRNMVDYHVIVDLLPNLATHFFAGAMPVKGGVSHVQAAMLVAMGLQHKTLDEIAGELELPASQAMALFNKLMRKFNTFLRTLKEDAVAEEIPGLARLHEQAQRFVPQDVSVEEELEDGAETAKAALREQQAKLMEGIDMSQYAIKGEEADWEQVLKNTAVTGQISVKGTGEGKQKGKRRVIHEDGVSTKHVKEARGSKKSKHKKSSKSRKH